MNNALVPAIHIFFKSLSCSCASDRLICSAFKLKILDGKQVLLLLFGYVSIIINLDQSTWCYLTYFVLICFFFLFSFFCNVLDVFLFCFPDSKCNLYAFFVTKVVRQLYFWEILGVRIREESWDCRLCFTNLNIYNGIVHVLLLRCQPPMERKNLHCTIVEGLECKELKYIDAHWMNED